VPAIQILHRTGNCRGQQVSSTFKIMTSRDILRFVRLTENGREPSRESSKAAGLDLYSALDTTVPAKEKRLIPTDLQIKLPDGCYGRIAARCELALAHQIDIGGEVIDQDYHGNISVINITIQILRLLFLAVIALRNLFAKKFINLH